METFDPDIIKIDGNFIEQVGHDNQVRTIISSIHKTAMSTNSLTVAKHVLNEGDQKIIRKTTISFTHRGY